MCVNIYEGGWTQKGNDSDIAFEDEWEGKFLHVSWRDMHVAIAVAGLLARLGRRVNSLCRAKFLVWRCLHQNIS
jgi:hypothetical protein